MSGKRGKCTPELREGRPPGDRDRPVGARDRPDGCRRMSRSTLTTDSHKRHKPLDLCPPNAASSLRPGLSIDATLDRRLSKPSTPYDD